MAIVLGCARERSGREGFGHNLQWISGFGQVANHFRNQVNHVRIILHLFKRLDIHHVAVAAQVVAGQVDQHHVLGRFFRVVVEFLGQFGIVNIVARAPERTGNGVDGGFPVFNDNLRFGRGAEEFVVAVIEIEQIRGGVQRPECPVHVEFIADERGRKPARQHNLEHVAPLAVVFAFLNNAPKLIVGKIRLFGPGRAERVGRIVSTGNQIADVVERYCAGVSIRQAFGFTFRR